MARGRSAFLVLVVFATVFTTLGAADDALATDVGSFDWNGVWSSAGPCSHTSCCCFVKADTEVLPGNKLNVTGVMEVRVVYIVLHTAGVCCALRPDCVCVWLGGMLGQGSICPTFKKTYDIHLTAELNPTHTNATISLIFGLCVRVVVAAAPRVLPIMTAVWPFAGGAGTTSSSPRKVWLHVAERWSTAARASPDPQYAACV